MEMFASMLTLIPDIAAELIEIALVIARPQALFYPPVSICVDIAISSAFTYTMLAEIFVS